MGWKYSSAAVSLFREYFDAFPEVISRIIDGHHSTNKYADFVNEFDLTRSSDPSMNVNGFVHGIDKDVVDRVVVWKERLRSVIAPVKQRTLSASSNAYLPPSMRGNTQKSHLSPSIPPYYP